MEARTSPRRRTPSRRFQSASVADRVDEGLVTKKISTTRRHAEVVEDASDRPEVTAVQSSSQSRSRRTRTAPETPNIARGDNKTPEGTGNGLESMTASQPSQADAKLNVKRTRPSTSTTRNKRPVIPPVPTAHDRATLVQNSRDASAIAGVTKLQVRGSLVSPTNAEMVLVRGEMKPNPFFETMPAPAVIIQRAPPLFLAGETTGMQQFIGQRIAHELSKGKSSRILTLCVADDKAEAVEQKNHVKQPPSFFGRLYDQASSTLGFGKVRRDGSSVDVKLPQPWDLPSVDEAHVIRLVRRLPRDAATVH